MSDLREPFVKGQNQTSRPASGEWVAAISSRSGSPPLTRTAAAAEIVSRLRGSCQSPAASYDQP